MSTEVNNSFESNNADLVLPRFNSLVRRANNEGFPAYVSWQTTLDAGGEGYVVAAPLTRRLLGVIEQPAAELDKRWFAEPFRAWRESDQSAPAEAVCLAALEETAGHQVSEDELNILLRKLFAGYGSVMPYPEIILECNDPERADNCRPTVGSAAGSDEDREIGFDARAGMSRLIRREFQGSRDESERRPLTLVSTWLSCRSLLSLKAALMFRFSVAGSVNTDGRIVKPASRW